MIERNSRTALLFVLLAIALFGALLAFAYIGHFSRYMADDYCTAAELRVVGFKKAQAFWYLNWTGRFAFTFFLSLAELIGPKLVPLLPSMALTSWLVSAFWSMRQIALLNSWTHPLLGPLLIAELVVFATINCTPNIVQSLYWQSGMLTYTAPLILLTIYVGIVSRAVRRRLQNGPVWFSLFLSVLVTFLAGGFSEVSVFLQTCGLSLAVAACWESAPDSFRRASLRPIIAGLSGSLMALCLVVFAPGNNIRQHQFPQPPNLFAVIELSLYHAARFVPSTAYHSPLTILLLVILPALLGSYLCKSGSKLGFQIQSRVVLRSLLFLALIALFLIFICFVPGVYMSTSLPDRARIIPTFVFVCMTVYGGYLVGMALPMKLSVWHPEVSWRQASGLIVITALMMLSPWLATRRVFKLAPRARVSASNWDKADREIREGRALGVMNFTVPETEGVASSLGPTPQPDLQLDRDPQDWKNKCVARYYGLNSIEAP